MGVDNWFVDSANAPSQAKNAVTAGKIGDLARNVGIVNADGTVNQTERLLTARARYGQKALLTGSSKDLGGERGQHAYIKLLTSKVQADKYLSANASPRDVSAKELLGPGGLVSKMADPGGDSKTGYDQFLLTSISCNMTEKTQITEVFGDNEVIYYFGRAPLVFNISGILIDSPDNNWFVDWLRVYNDFLRGSQLARNYELIKLVLPNMVITGSISAFSYTQDSSRDTDIPFNMQFIAKVVEPESARPIGMPTTNTLQFVNFSQVNGFTTQAQLNSLKGQVAMLTSKISDPTASLREKGAALAALGTGAGGGSDILASTGKDLLKFQKTIDGWTKAQQTYVDGIQKSAMYQTVTSSLNGIRTNLFSPVYGILSSLTKLVSNSFNSATRLFNNLITPVRNILRDITNISKKAVALVNLVNSSIKGFGRNVKGQLKGLRSDYKEAIKALKKAAGTIATSPASLSQSLKIMFSAGVLANDAPFLRTPAKLTFSSPTLAGLTRPASKISLLRAIGAYSAEEANIL